jgi:hypothetical protein
MLTLFLIIRKVGFKMLFGLRGLFEELVLQGSFELWL